MKRAGVIGWPVAHSLSPVLHGYWLNQHPEIQGSYEKIAAPPEQFADKIAELRDKGYVGVNVTVPHKEAAFALASSFGPASVYDKSSLITKASNVLIFRNGGIDARNTDWIGLRDSLDTSIGPGRLLGRNTIVLGAGGAARAATYALALSGATTTILNRTKPRADLVAKQISELVPSAILHSESWACWPQLAPKIRLLINTTSAGMTGFPPLDLDLTYLPNDAVVCDIVYNPIETPLLKAAKARGLATIDGLGMLMYQAVPSFQAFFDRAESPKVTSTLRATLEAALAAR